MKVVLATLAAAAVVVAGAAPAQGASKLERQVAALQRQVTTLNKQVKTLKQQVKTTSSCPTNAKTLPDVCLLALLGGYVALCDTAITADAFQNTWEAINQNEGKAIFPARQSVNDGGVCSGAFRVPRQETLVPPTVAPFQALLTAVLGRGSAFPRFLFLPPPLSWSTS